MHTGNSSVPIYVYLRFLLPGFKVQLQRTRLRWTLDELIQTVLSFRAAFVHRHNEITIFNIATKLGYIEKLNKKISVSCFGYISFAIVEQLKKGVVLSRVRKITSTHSNRRVQQVWHSLTITHVAHLDTCNVIRITDSVRLAPYYWDYGLPILTHRGSGLGDIGDSGSALCVYCSCHASFPCPPRLRVPSPTFPFTRARHHSSTAV